MSIDQLVEHATDYSLTIAAIFISIPVFALLLRFIHGKENGENTPWKYFYSILIYLACIPGIFSLTLTAYTLLFTQINLLTVNAIVYFIPIVSMFFTLVIIRKTLSFEKIPGFNKLSGLMLLLSTTFTIAFVLSRLRIWIFFGGSIFAFLIFCVILFLGLMFGTKLLFGAFKKK